MAIENPLDPFAVWFSDAAPKWLAVVGGVLAAAIVLGYIVSAVRSGPVVAALKVRDTLLDAIVDLVNISPRRVYALSRLALQEAFRRRVVLTAFAVIGIVMMFAVWFLHPGNRDPAKLYLSLVLNSSTYLVWMLALFLSAFSLPTDITKKTIYTVVTKPVRPSEIVLGRIIGFSAVGTLILAVMGVVSCFFVQRSLQHTHEIAEGNLSFASSANAPRQGRTSKVQNHSHQVTIDPNTPLELGYLGEDVSSGRVTELLVKPGDTVGYRQPVAKIDTGAGIVSFHSPMAGRVNKLQVRTGDTVPVGGALMTLERGETERVNGHWHEVVPERQGDKVVYAVSRPHDFFQARVADYGKLRFKDENGNDADRGVSIGNEWTYRSYIEGGTLAAAVWRFSNITPERYPDGLPLNMQFGIFRTHKGDIEKGIPGSITLRNPQTKVALEVSIFTPKEFTIHREFVRRHLPSLKGTGKTVDLFEQFVTEDGELEIEIQCVPVGQYFGMAQPDMFLLAENASFEVNLAKGYLGIWFQMVLITAFGVMYSTFLNGPVSMLATLFTLVLGSVSDFMRKLIAEEIPGGGPFESTWRILTHKNQQSELDPGVAKVLAESFDDVFRGVLYLPVSIFPSLGELAGLDWVANGFDIPMNDICIHSMTSLSFLVPVALAGYLFLKLREVAK